jgi:RNA-directed DNA polymerase
MSPNLAELGASMLEGRYQPLPPRWVEVRKPGGEKRSIGLLAVRDRVAQRAVHQVLEPLFDEQFLDCSYGFRAGRSVEDAIHRVLCYHQAGCDWVFDGDVAACFDTLDHRLLMRFISETVRERPVLHLIEGWLETGVLEADAEVYRIPGAWERLMDGLAGRLRSSTIPSLPRWTDDGADEGVGDLAMAWDDGWKRRELLRNLGTDVLLGGLVAARPALEHAIPGLRRLIRRKGVIWGAAGLVGAGALAATWWVLWRLAPRPQGALQGGALSPLLANVYLHRFDQAMTGVGQNLVRFADDLVLCCPGQEDAEYADDLVLCCPGQEDAEYAGELAARELADLRLRLNPAKSRVVSFNQGFSFLGHRFGGRRS